MAYNKLVYTVTMTDTVEYHSVRERQIALNGVIYHAIKKLKENNEPVNNEVKVKRNGDGCFRLHRIMMFKGYKNPYCRKDRNCPGI